MPRYIDADALREKMFHEAFEKDTQDQRWDSGCWIRYHLFEDAIDSIPTADVVERKKGKWIEYVNSHCECPFCHKEWSFFENMTEWFNFCPNCGADMRGEQDADH